MLLGKEIELGLGALHEALAHEATGADGDLRLQNVIAGAERIAPGVDEGEHALPLIVVQPLPDMG